MPQVFIHYFSGTGNTKRAVDLIADYLAKNGHEVRQFLIGNDKPRLSENAAFNLFAFPVLSWSAPGFVKNYVRRLPQGGGAKAAVFAVYAGNPVQAPRNMSKILNRKQFEVFLTGGAQYPDNWTQMMNPPAEAEQKEIIQQGDKMALDFAAAFARGERQFFVDGWLGNLITGAIAIMFGFIGSRFLGKTYIADPNCNQCGICMKTCPVNAIQMKGLFVKKPRWSFSCQDCARCINICPQRAIQVSIPRLFLHFIIYVMLICVSISLAGLAGKYLPGAYQAIGWVAGLVVALAVALWIQFAIIDRLFFLLEQIPGIRRFFGWNFTRNYRRYTAPGFKPTVQRDGKGIT
jgi:NAD-dependent dihydropyrimidine dehydrogenase PreA subunit